MAVLPLNTNIFSLKAQRRLSDTTVSISKTFERLSSGLRINRAGDDAAGLAVSSQLQNDARVYTQGIRNVNDGISALNIAQGSTEQLSSVLQRLKELATQAANGTFSLQQRLALDKESYALTNEFNRIVATTKFNNQNLIDGTLDTLSIQAGYGTNGRVAFQLGEQLDYAQGLGTFGAGTSLSGATGGAGGMTGLTTGDVNGDGKLDIVTGSYGASFEVKLGNGDGTFQTATSYTQPGPSFEIKLADVNGDGWLDVLDVGLPGTGGTGLFVRLNNGNGTFGSATSYNISSIGAGTDANLSVGDLNGDGIQDVVVTSYYAYVSKNTAVLLGRGNGTFQVGASYDSGQIGLFDSDLGDLNGDGKLDMVAVDRYGGAMRIALGRGDGTFGSFISNSNMPQTYSSVTLADLNHDGILDLAAGSTSTYLLYTSLGRGDGTFASNVTYAIFAVGNNPHDIVARDLNNDGYLDLAFNMGAGKLGILTNNGDGTFQVSSSATTTGAATGVRTAVGDFNGDGVPDVVTSDTTGHKFNLYLANTQDLSSIARLNLTTRADALAALSYIDTAFDRVQAELGNIGSSQSRLSSALNTLTTSRDNFSAANSRIVDADIAQESANLVRNQILQRAGAAVLAQANAQPNLVLDLLKR